MTDDPDHPTTGDVPLPDDDWFKKEKQELEEIIQNMKRVSPNTQTTEADLGSLPDADPWTARIVWILIMLTLCLIVGGSFVVIAWAALNKNAQDATDVSKLILPLFTAVFGLISGLFLPSPINTGAKKRRN